MTMTTSTSVKGKFPSVAPATDYGVGMLAITGRTVVITGTKVDGTSFVRTLANVSVVPGHGPTAHIIVGNDTGIGKLRSFRLATVATLRLRNGTATVSGADLVATVEFHLKDPNRQVTEVRVLEEAA